MLAKVCGRRRGRGSRQEGSRDEKTEKERQRERVRVNGNGSDERDTPLSIMWLSINCSHARKGGICQSVLRILCGVQSMYTTNMYSYASCRMDTFVRITLVLSITQQHRGGKYCW